MTTQAVPVGEVLSQLPEDLRSGEPPRADLAGVLALSSAGHVPAGRFSRFWTLGTLQGKIAAAYTFWWLRGMWVGADERERALNEAHLTSAVRVLGTMSHLRGAVMKLGQVMAAWPGVAPQEFADVLGRLHFEAPPMHFALLRESVRSELGVDVGGAFATFEQNASAAASLGQVHRATLKNSGASVAVKVQYPGIARAIAADIANIRVLTSPMRLGQDGDNLRDQLADIETMLALEVDYAAEAENLRTAARTLAGLEGVFVPRVHDALSTRRVLTMDWVEGVHIDEYMKTSPSQEDRDRRGERMARSFMRLCYSAHLLYCDHHPGNCVFMNDGRLGLIDFGCARRYTHAEVEYLTYIERAGFQGDDAIRAAIVRASDLSPSQQHDRARLDLMLDWFHWMYEPVNTDAPFDFGDDTYLQRGMVMWGEMVRRRYTRSLPVNIWINKSFIGLRAMLHRLKARVPLGRILREETSVDRVVRKP